MGRLPFAAGIFWSTLGIVAVLVVVGWWVIVKVTGYTITAADYGGSTISTVLLAYLIHLWLLPVEHPDEHSEGTSPPEADDEADTEVKHPQDRS